MNEALWLTIRAVGEYLLLGLPKENCLRGMKLIREGKNRHMKEKNTIGLGRVGFN